MLQKKKLFNPYSLDTNEIIDGDTSNIFILSNSKYEWSKKLYRIMTTNIWFPESISLQKDKIDYVNLNEDERFCFDRVLSFLTFLDSIQTNNLPRITDYITSPEIISLITVQSFQEVVHSQSYSYIIDSIIPLDKKNSAYQMWKNDNVLLNRNKYISDIYEEFSLKPTEKNLYKIIVANYILESIYFYNGFMFFYSLADKKSMLGVYDEIRYIHRDELNHVQLFKNIINTLQNTNKNFNKLMPKSLITEMFDNAVKEEIKWTEHLIKKPLLNINKENTELYTKYLANNRLLDINCKPIYSVVDNPYLYLEKMADLDSLSVKTNFFENSVTNYNLPDAIDGWDLI